jgi:apolipoprotein D and lipocalin family protein
VSRLTLIGALVLAACVAKPAAAPAYRIASAPIWSAAAFQAGQVAGTWRQVAAFQPAGSGCDQGAIAITPEAGGLRLAGSLCLAGRVETVSGLAELVGPGRLRVRGEDWWVLWVDSGYRTMAIGTPSGRFGFVLDRGAIPADRLEAAREIFDFNGYATEAMTAL